MRINITSTFRGYTSALAEIYRLIGDSNWSVKKVKFDKKEDRYIAEAKNAHGESISKTGPNEEMAVRNLYLAITRRNHMRSSAFKIISMWKYDWTDKLQPIAEAYAKAPIYDPKAAAAFKALADDSTRRADILRKQLHIEETNDPEPYKDAQEMADDIHKRRHFTVSLANSEHPVWTPEQNVCFVPGTLVRTLTGFKPIEEITIGDFVLSANGQWNRVYDTFNRHYEGDVYDITTSGSARPITTTADHPFLSLIGNHKLSRNTPCTPYVCARSYYGKPIDAEKNHEVEWVSAKDLTINSWLPLCIGENTKNLSRVSIPEELMGRRTANKRINRKGRSKDRWVAWGQRTFKLTDDFLWAIGFYIAEGWSSTNSIGYALHADEVEFRERLKSFWTQCGFKVKDESHGENGWVVHVNSAPLGRWFPLWLGKGANHKRIPEELMQLPNDRLRILAQGIFDGDGRKCDGSIDQTSLHLALQLIEIGHRLGYHPTIYRSHDGDKNHAFVYRVHEVVSEKVRIAGNKQWTWDICNRSFRKVLSIDSRHYAGRVYNISVENDETYVVEHLPVHNCFRIVHDVLGHAVSGGDFGWEGENRACRAHFPLLSTEAQKALWTECIGQTGYGAHYRGFGPQKVALFPEFYEPAQEAEGVHPNFPGVHPSQTVAPVAMPAIKPSPSVGLPEGTIAPHQEALGLTPMMSPESKVRIGPPGWME